MKDLNKNNPFKTPEKYFEGFDARLMKKLSKESSNIPKEEGFAVPENYFDSVHAKILDNIAFEERQVITLNPLKKHYYTAASIAAVILLFFGLNWNTSEEVSFENLAEVDIERYFETNGFDLSTYEIAEVIPFNELEINDILTTGFEEENLIDYLDNNTEDFNELNLEDDE
jgi:hypothetical protein